MSHQYATIADTVYFWFASNDTSGSGNDGATPLFDVREAGAAASAIPLLSGTPTLLSHANYPAGCYEVAVAATTGNGFAAGDTFAVFCTLAVDSQNPTGMVGSCTLGAAPANLTEYLGVAVTGSIITSDDVGLLMTANVVATVTSQTIFIMTDSIVTLNNMVGNIITCKDVNATQSASRYITAINQTTDTITINAAFPFTVEVGDEMRVFRDIHPTYALNVADVSTATNLQLAQDDLDILTGADGVNLLTATQASIDAIEASTSPLTYTIANQVDANMQSVDDILLAESGTGGQQFGAA